MIYKNRQWADCPRSLQKLPEEQETKNLTESIGGVPPKDAPKVMSVSEKSLGTLKWEK